MKSLGRLLAMIEVSVCGEVTILDVEYAERIW